jgi:hypothetical protein
MFQALSRSVGRKSHVRDGQNAKPYANKNKAWVKDTLIAFLRSASGRTKHIRAVTQPTEDQFHIFYEKGLISLRLYEENNKLRE